MKLQTPFFFFFFLNRHHHKTANAPTPTLTQPATQHIPTHTNTSPISSTDAGPLHSKWHEACTVNTKTVVTCMMRTCQTDREWDTALALWPLGQVRAVRTERADWTSDHCHCYLERRERKRETREEERGRHEERDTRGERREKKRDRRSRVYVQNALVCTFKTPVTFVTRAF